MFVATEKGAAVSAHPLGPTDPPPASWLDEPPEWHGVPLADGQVTPLAPAAAVAIVVLVFVVGLLLGLLLGIVLG